MVRRLPLLVLYLAAAGLLSSALRAADPPLLIDFAAPKVLDQVKANGGDGVTWKLVDVAGAKALEVTCSPTDNGYPGVSLDPANGPWDLSAYNRVEADFTNLSEVNLTICLRVDNDGDWKLNPWNAENVTIPAGKSGTARVTFGRSFGNSGFALDPSKVVRFLCFTTKPKQPVSFRIDAIRPAGKPGERPPGSSFGEKPAGGVLLDFQNKLEDKGATSSIVGEGADRRVRIAFAQKGAARQGVIIHSPEGQLWDLSDHTRADFALRNPGDAPVKVILRVDNRNANGYTPADARNCAVAEATLAAGAAQTVSVPFWGSRTWDGNKDSQEQLASDAVAAVSVWCERPAADSAVELSSVRSVLGPPPALPDWLGKRPPVPGEWTQTLNENFDGDKLDGQLWNLPEKPWASWWGNTSNNMPELGYVKDGNLVIRAERRDFSTSDDAKIRARHYATSVVTSYDKWAQCYGYFEARMKLPTALGLWPAFWMMPDRGREFQPQNARQDTGNGAMEIDIMEALVRYGPHRYNVAMHWDGYGKDHKSIGTERIYCQPDQDGYIVSGLLWEPGKMTFYANGQVVGVYANERVSKWPGYLMFTLPTGGWGPIFIDDKALPDTFEIDWVRCWQKAEWK